MGIRLPTFEEQARIDAHWAEVRAGIRTPSPEPNWKRDKNIVEFHRFRANQLIKQAAWHAQQAISAVDDRKQT